MMNKCFLILMVVLSSAHVAIAQQAPDIDVLHYRFELSLEDGTDSIVGKATVRFKSLAQVNKVTLNLTGRNAGKGMLVSAVRVNNQVVNYQQMDDKLVMNLSKTLKAGDIAEINVLYSGIPAGGLIISKSKFGQRTFFGDNWPNRAQNWLPCVDEPRDKASVEFLVEAPERYKVISNGILQEESHRANNRKLTYWKEDVPLPTKIMVIGVADFDVQLSGTVSGIPVSSWVYPENSKEGFYDYGVAPDILSYFIKTVGPYGYKKLAHVQSKTTYGGLENAGAIFYAEGSVTGTRRSESTVAHETAHQWFGDMATETAFSHLWLSEGFATYMSALYMGSKYGHDTLIYTLKKDRLRVVNFYKTYKQPVVDTYATDYMKLLNANSYQKGGWVLHMLRIKLGDDVFYKSIRKYYSTFAGKNANTDDLRKVVEQVSGENLQPFFQQWLYTAGHPDLDVTWAYIPGKKTVQVTVAQKQAHVFFFPLEVQWKGVAGGKAVTSHFNITKQKQVFTVSTAGKPVDVTLDPNTHLLFEGSIHEAQ
jgi:aminopeptidase N